jgi:hypothetical protein
LPRPSASDSDTRARDRHLHSEERHHALVTKLRAESLRSSSRARAALLLALTCVSTASAADIPFTHFVIDPANPHNPYNKAVGDIDGDGFPDALVASSTTEGLYWYQYPTWAKHAIRSTGGWEDDMQTGDVDADGDLDVIIPNSREWSGTRTRGRAATRRPTRGRSI